MNSVAEIYFTDKDLKDRMKEIKEDSWGDLQAYTLKAVKRLLEHTMEIEVQDLIGTSKWQHSKFRGSYRNGSYSRGLLTSYGYINNLRVPRVREGGVEFKTIERYKHRHKDVDKLVLGMFLSGVSTRRVQEVLKPLIGEGMISAATVSEISKTLDREVQNYHNRSLSDTYVHIIADAVYIKVKSPIHSMIRCILVAYGMKRDGTREMIDFRIAGKAESQAEWECFLANLCYRGLEGKNLKLVSMDGNKGAWNAVDLVWPHVKKQRCIAHKMRNVANYLAKSIQKSCLEEAKEIYKADSYNAAITNFKHWAKTWRNVAPKAVSCIEKDLEALLTFYQFPQHLWKKIRTTNIIERMFREVRRRTRPMSCFTNTNSVERIIYALFLRQNNIWRSKPLKITQDY